MFSEAANGSVTSGASALVAKIGTGFWECLLSDRLLSVIAVSFLRITGLKRADPAFPGGAGVGAFALFLCQLRVRLLIKLPQDARQVNARAVFSGEDIDIKPQGALPVPPRLPAYAQSPRPIPVPVS